MNIAFMILGGLLAGFGAIQHAKSARNSESETGDCAKPVDNSENALDNQTANAQNVDKS